MIKLSGEQNWGKQNYESITVIFTKLTNIEVKNAVIILN